MRGRGCAALSSRKPTLGARSSQPVERLGRTRAGEEEALDQGDAEPLEQRALLGALDTFGDDVQVQRARHEDDRLHDGAVGRVGVQLADERAVDLDAVDREVAKVASEE